jgi:hypothetical protein
LGAKRTAGCRSPTLSYLSQEGGSSSTLVLRPENGQDVGLFASNPHVQNFEVEGWGLRPGREGLGGALRTLPPLCRLAGPSKPSGEPCPSPSPSPPLLAHLCASGLTRHGVLRGGRGGRSKSFVAAEARSGACRPRGSRALQAGRPPQPLLVLPNSHTLRPPSLPAPPSDAQLGTLRDALDGGAFKSHTGVNYAAVLDTAADIARALFHLHRQQVPKSAAGLGWGAVRARISAAQAPLRPATASSPPSPASACQVLHSDLKARA